MIYCLVGACITETNVPYAYYSALLFFFDVVTTQNDHPRYVKHVLGGIYVFSPYLGIECRWGRGPKGLIHNLPMQLFTLGCSKSEIYLFDIVITQNELGYVLNGRDGQLHPHRVHRLLGRVLAPCTLHGDSYHRQEAWVGRCAQCVAESTPYY